MSLNIFDDTTIDIQTGELMGRYVAEERDTGRRLRACHCALAAAAPSTTPRANAAEASLMERLDRIECALAELAERAAEISKPARQPTKAKSKK